MLAWCKIDVNVAFIRLPSNWNQSVFSLQNFSYEFECERYLELLQFATGRKILFDSMQGRKQTLISQ